MHMGNYAADYESTSQHRGHARRNAASSGGSCRRNETRKGTLSCACSGKALRRVHAWLGRTLKAFDAGSIASDRIRELQENPVERWATSVRRMDRAPPEPTWHRLRTRIRGRSQGTPFSVAVLWALSSSSRGRLPFVAVEGSRRRVAALRRRDVPAGYGDATRATSQACWAGASAAAAGSIRRLYESSDYPFPRRAAVLV